MLGKAFFRSIDRTSIDADILSCTLYARLLNRELDLLRIWSTTSSKEIGDHEPIHHRYQRHSLGKVQ